MLLFSKSDLYLFWKSGTKFPADWRNINDGNLKFLVLKNLPVWSLWGMNSKPDFVAARTFYPVIWSQVKEKLLFPFFLIHSARPAHAQIHTHTHTHKHTLLVQLHIQHDTKKCSLLHEIFLWTPKNGRASVGRPAKPVVRSQDVVRKTCRERWMIGTDGERESGNLSHQCDLMRMFSVIVECVLSTVKTPDTELFICRFIVSMIYVYIRNYTNKSN